MFLQVLGLVAPLALAGVGQAASVPLHPRAAQACYANETPNLICYNPPAGTPQNVNPNDVLFIAQYLRAYGSQTNPGRIFTMPASATHDCAEWTLFAYGSALALAKHIDDRHDSSVLFTDIANTIDGGVDATGAQKAAALISCGSSGGSVGVQVNGTIFARAPPTSPPSLGDPDDGGDDDGGDGDDSSNEYPGVGGGVGGGIGGGYPGGGNGYPGGNEGYPGGGYPGDPYPGGGSGYPNDPYPGRWWWRWLQRHHHQDRGQLLINSPLS
ncbi:hypothetical protein F4777DRAFT_474805 [Nemania sp. FL0916]|nr:hypothetical protein F4777DRAFT_474805 [Nemania sp. FL0916]